MTDILSGIQTLPLEILFAIFDHSGWVLFGPISRTCRALKKAVDVYLQRHSVLRITNRPYEGQEYDRILAAHFLNLICFHKSIALSIRKIDVVRRGESLWETTAFTREAQAKLATILPSQSGFGGTDARARFEDKTRPYLLYVLLLCRHVESISITTDTKIRWYQVAPMLQDPIGSGYRLKYFRINYDRSRSYHDNHDIQDLWLFLTAPLLKTFEGHGVRQENNLYTGAADRAAIRTIYWPTELEVPSLYHHRYLGECDRSQPPPWNLPKELPRMITGPMVCQGLTQLQKLVLHELDWPQTWFPILLPCLKNIKYLDISIKTRRDHAGSDAPTILPDLRLFGKGLNELGRSLQTLIFDIQMRPGDSTSRWAAHMGHCSMGSLQAMQELRHATLPWYTLHQPCDWQSNTVDIQSNPAESAEVLQICLPRRLEKLELTRCDLARPGDLVEMLNTMVTSPPQEKGSDIASKLESIVLQAKPRVEIIQADIVFSVGHKIDMMLDEVEVSDDGYVMRPRAPGWRE